MSRKTCKYFSNIQSDNFVNLVTILSDYILNEISFFVDEEKKNQPVSLEK